MTKTEAKRNRRLNEKWAAEAEEFARTADGITDIERALLVTMATYSLFAEHLCFNRFTERSITALGLTPRKGLNLLRRLCDKGFIAPRLEDDEGEDYGALIGFDIVVPQGEYNG